MVGKNFILSNAVNINTIMDYYLNYNYNNILLRIYKILLISNKQSKTI